MNNGLVDHPYSCSSSSSSSDLSEKAAQGTNDNIMSLSQEYNEEALVPHIALSGANAVSGSLNSAGQTMTFEVDHPSIVLMHTHHDMQCHGICTEVV